MDSLLPRPENIFEDYQDFPICSYFEHAFCISYVKNLYDPKSSEIKYKFTILIEGTIF